MAKTSTRKRSSAPARETTAVVLARLDERVGVLQDDLGQVRDHLARLNGKVAEHEKRFAAGQEQHQTIEERHKRMEAKIDALQAAAAGVFRIDNATLIKLVSIVAWPSSGSSLVDRRHWSCWRRC